MVVRCRFPLSYGLLSAPITISILLAAKGTTLNPTYYTVTETLWVLNGASHSQIRPCYLDLTADSPLHISCY